MKKMIAVVVSVLMVLGLAACGSKAEQPSSAGEENSVESVAGDVEENATDDEKILTGDAADVTADSVENTDKDMAEELNGNETENFADTKSDMEADAAANEDTQGSTDSQGAKALVAYFSATNTTKGVAEHIANGLNADIYEIVPEEPYTDADLNYNDDNSRTTIEMNDPSARPAISGSVENMEQYDIVFVGFPIWHGQAPRIISTFLERYDFAGKTIVPFCTSGSSGVGSSATNLEQLISGADWLPGKRFNGGDSQDTVMEWIDGLGLNLGE